MQSPESVSSQSSGEVDCTSVSGQFLFFIAFLLFIPAMGGGNGVIPSMGKWADPLCFAATTLAIVGIVLQVILKDRYLLSDSPKRLTFTRQLGPWTWQLAAVELSQIQSLGVQGKYVAGKIPWYWEYCPVALLHNGKILGLGLSQSGSEGFAASQARCHELVSALGVGCFPARPKGILKASGSQFSYQERNSGETVIQCLILALIAGGIWWYVNR